MKERIVGSFRDPDGFLYWQDGVLKRQVNTSYKAHYDRLMESGLYQELVADNILIEHAESKRLDEADEIYKVIEPELVPFISYPYEWCFSQLKDAALLTLDIQFRAIKKGLSLKDASAYNIQFIDGKPIFIDTLSFETYSTGEPWVAYRQFCQHFLAPLALMSHIDVRLSHLLRSFIDGVPLDLASKLLPSKTKLSPSLLMHIHFHARAQIKHADDGREKPQRQISVNERGLLGILDGLKRCIQKLSWLPANTEWGDYYDDTNYNDLATESKKKIVANLAQSLKPRLVWDLGANTGEFTQQVVSQSEYVVSWDIDAAAVEKHYLYRKQSATGQTVLPLILDLTNPSSGLGWASEERDSLEERGKADLGLALALVHHIAISNNVPFQLIAEFMSRICKDLIIEFVPKSDSQVQRLLRSREDIFPHYDEQHFVRDFSQYFDLADTLKVEDSERTIFLFRQKN